EQAGPRVIGAAEAQRVQICDGPGAHRKNVPEDAAHTRRRALERLDERWMIVGFHLEHRRLPIADVDDSGVLAGALADARALGRKLAEKRSRGLIGAMLAPHHGKDAELGKGGDAAEELENTSILVVFEPMLAREL